MDSISILNYILYYNILCCTILYYILYYNILFCTILYYILYYNILFCTIHSFILFNSAIMDWREAPTYSIYKVITTGGHHYT